MSHVLLTTFRQRSRSTLHRMFWLAGFCLVALCLVVTPGRAQPPTTPTGTLPTTPAGIDAYAPAWQQPVVRQQPAPALPPAGVDLEVTHISRTPAYYRYCVTYPNNKPTLCPGTENEPRWPAPGEIVTFTGHIANQGTETSPAIPYTWALDDSIVVTGTLPALPPQAETTVTYQWPWGHTMDGERVLDDHTITLAVDPAGTIPETYETNNTLRDYTNAMSFNIGITPAMVAAYDIPIDPIYPYSAENWLQRQVAAMNWNLDNAIYPLTPQGARLHVRLDTILISDSPPTVDRQHDGYWFVDADYRLVSGGYDPLTDTDWYLVHELSHQIGLIDLYAYNVFDSTNHVLDQHGLPVNFSDFWARPGLMGGGDIAPYSEWYRYASHSAAGAAATSGYRRGYYGEYQFDIPAQVSLQVLDNTGQPAAGVQVTLFQRNGPADWIGDISVDNIPEISGVTDSEGRFLLPNRTVDGAITTATGHTLHDNPLGIVDVVGPRNRFLISLQAGTHQEFHWLDLTDLNLAYWGGQTDEATLLFASHLPGANAPAAPTITSARVAHLDQTLCWDDPGPLPSAGYYVYRIGPPEFAAYDRVSGLVAGPCYTYSSDWEYAVYAVTAVDPAGRESGFSSLVWLPVLGWPTGITSQGITALSDGHILLLDRHFGRVLQQRPDGRYLRPLTSPHMGLVGVNYLASDAAGRLYFTHPDGFVRVADAHGGYLFDFGQPGSGPGQFQTPAGIAITNATASTPACTYGGPYETDAKTLLLLHLDGSFNGADGEPGTPQGVTFTEGYFGSAALFDNMDRLTYDTAGNLEREAGALEFWFRPDWNGSDNLNYVLFEVGDGWFNRLRVAKDGANNLRLMVWDSSTEYGVATNVASWQAGEWHHIAATWQGSTLQLFVDGVLRDRTENAGVPDTLANSLVVGAANNEPQWAHGTIDELRISWVPRLGNSDICQPTIFVADSGNNRLQAFDSSGRYLGQIGSLGSGMGQFNQPQGVTVQPNGEIVVVDSGNNRLQLFTFDGQQFTLLREITADFAAPSHIATHGPDYLVIADTNHNSIKLLWQELLIATYTAPNDGSPGDFAQPWGVTALPDGTIVVVDQGNQRVVRLWDVLPPLPVYRLRMPVMAGD